MRAVTMRAFGDASGLEVTEVADPRPGAGEVLIQTEAVGVGGVDAVIRRGTLQGYGFREGMVPGSEIAGRVIEVGEGVDTSWIGRRVWAFTGRGGAYAEQAVVALDDVTPLPPALTAVDAVALGSAGPVAHFALARAGFAPGKTVLVRGGSGSIGIMAVQLAAAAGARVVAVTTSSRERGERLRALGATAVLERSGAGADPGAFDAILDTVGGEALPAFVDRLAPNGSYVVAGVVAGFPPPEFGMSLFGLFPRSPSLAMFSLDSVPVPERNRVRAEQFEAAARGDLHPVVHEVLPLADAADAHRRMDAGEVFGRFVLTL